jgi:hypothetical protein
MVPALPGTWLLDSFLMNAVLLQNSIHHFSPLFRENKMCTTISLFLLSVVCGLSIFISLSLTRQSAVLFLPFPPLPLHLFYFSGLGQVASRRENFLTS